jgi:hypothetical protein
MDDLHEESKNRRLVRFISKHGAMAVFSLLGSYLFMPTAKSEFVWELLIWLGLVFYLGLLLTIDFVILRGRGRLITLFVILTGVAIVIVFPFSGIRRAQYRSNYLAEKNPTTSYGHHGFKSEIFRWQILPDNTVIPACLTWRLVNGGVYPEREVYCTPSELFTLPKWFLQEAKSLSIEWDSFEDLPPNLPRRYFTEHLSPSSIYISCNLKNDELRNDTGGVSDLSWITNCVDFGNCEVLKIIRVRFDEVTWKHVISSPALTHLSLISSNAGENQLHGLQPTLERLCWIDNIAVEPKSFIKALQLQTALRNLFVDQQLLSNELLDLLKAHNAFENLFIYGTRSTELSLHEIHSVERKFRLFMVGFEKLNLSSPHVIEFIASAKAPSILLCRFEASDLQAYFNATLDPKFSTTRCVIRRHELEKFGRWLVERGFVETQPFSSGDARQALQDVFDDHGKRSIFSDIQID